MVLIRVESYTCQFKPGTVEKNIINYRSSGGNQTYALHGMNDKPVLRGGPLDILGGGVSDPKKKFMQEIELEKKIPACA